MVWTAVSKSRDLTAPAQLVEAATLELHGLQGRAVLQAAVLKEYLIWGSSAPNRALPCPVDAISERVGVSGTPRLCTQPKRCRLHSQLGPTVERNVLSVRSKGDELSLHNTLNMIDNNLALLLRGSGHRRSYFRLFVPQLPWRESAETYVSLTRASLETLKCIRVLQVPPLPRGSHIGQAPHNIPGRES